MIFDGTLTDIHFRRDIFCIFPFETAFDENCFALFRHLLNQLIQLSFKRSVINFFLRLLRFCIVKCGKLNVFADQRFRSELFFYVVEGYRKKVRSKLVFFFYIGPFVPYFHEYFLDHFLRIFFRL